jgi:hypothetical protein
LSDGGGVEPGVLALRALDGAQEVGLSFSATMSKWRGLEVESVSVMP